MKKLTKNLLAGAMLVASTAAASAGSQLAPGISTGIPLGAPLPEGLYVISIPSWGTRTTTPNADVFAAAPAWVIWSTPWTVFGGRVLFDTVTPYLDVNVRGAIHRSGFANTFLDAQIKWDLGGGLFGGLQGGVYLPAKNELNDLGIAHNWSAFQGIAAFSYLKDGWDLSSTFVVGTGHDAPKGSDPGAAWFNADFTATKKFDKFEVGAVAFGSFDLSAPYASYDKQSQFAVGGLVGYDFGPVNVQLKLTTDIYEKNYNGKDTRVWANVIIPLWNPKPAPTSPVVAKN
ncbi:MAG: transporter [Hyphomicrobiales bacterium]|nr:transporter [Hyphomicrobiales bacterium]